MVIRHQIEKIFHEEKYIGIHRKPGQLSRRYQQIKKIIIENTHKT